MPITVPWLFIIPIRIDLYPSIPSDCIDFQKIRAVETDEVKILGKVKLVIKKALILLQDQIDDGVAENYSGI